MSGNPEEHIPKVAVVTGAASGIGAATAIRFSKAGVRVVLVDLNERALATMEGSLEEGTFAFCPIDVSNAEAPDAVRAAIPRGWGSVSILVNNAGISPKKDGKSVGLSDTDDQLWQRVMAVNISAAFRLCREFVPGMKEGKWGRVINISSQAGRTQSFVAGPSYMASKAAMLGLTRSIASEFAPYGVTANSIAPGRIATGMVASLDPEVNAKYEKLIPVLRFGTSDEIAAAVEFFAADSSGFITGTVLDVNGGFFMA